MEKEDLVSKKMMYVSILFLILAGCRTFLSETKVTNTITPVIMSDTWTPGPTNNPGITITPTPTTPPPTDTPAVVGSPIGPNPTGVPSSSAPPLISGDEITITSIHMFTPEKGWAVGHQQGPVPRILLTKDAGRSWEDLTPPLVFSTQPYMIDLNPITFFWDQTTAWVLYTQEVIAGQPNTQRIWRTDDSGLTWTPSEPLPYPIDLLTGTPGQFFFLNPQQGWFLSHSEITHMHDYSNLFGTLDGGQTWLLVNQPGDSMIETLVNTEMAYANSNQGWMLKDSLGGFEPFLEVTWNAGYSWEQVDLPAPDGDWINLDRRCIGYDPVFFPDRSGAFLLNCVPYNDKIQTYDLEDTTSYIYRSNDFGYHWQIQELPSTVTQLDYLDDQLGFALGRNHYRTRDGGASWQLIKNVTWSGQFSFISSHEAWAVAREGDEIALVHTSDGGLTYEINQPLIIK